MRIVILTTAGLLLAGFLFGQTVTALPAAYQTPQQHLSKIEGMALDSLQRKQQDLNAEADALKTELCQAHGIAPATCTVNWQTREISKTEPPKPEAKSEPKKEK